MKRVFAFLVLLLTLAPLAATAQDQDKPAPWESYPTREVDRPILPAANGYLMSIVASSFTAQDRLDNSGRTEELIESISVFNLDLRLNYGILDRWDAFIGMPYATAQTSEFSSGGIGNVYLGSRVALLATDRWQLATGLQLSLPTGDAEYHYHLENDKVITENFRTGNPGLDYLPEIEARYKVNSNLSLRLRAQYFITGSGKTLLNYIGGEDVEKNVDPGDGWRLDFTAAYQVSDRWVIPVGINYYQAGETEYSKLNFNDGQQLLELRAGVVFQVSPEFEIALTGRTPFAGQNVYLATPIGLELRSRF